jgi:hypothetical protein
MNCARKHGRYGHRDATMILVAYRHEGLKRRCDGDSAARTATHCKALLRTMGNVTSRRVKSQ